MLRVLAVDDEVPALEEIACLLSQDPRIERVATAVGGVTALQDMVQMIGRGERLDGVFLDIRMPGLDGLDLARLIAGFPNPPRLVFVAADEDCAVQAFELEAVDYLLKPLRADRLAEAVRRLEAAVPAVAGPAPEDVIPVELAGRTRFVPQQAVWFAEAQGDYVRLHTDEGSYLVRMPLASLERRWADSGFIRVHRSTLVSVRHVSELRFDGGRVMIQVGTETLPVSRRHTRQVREQLVRRFRDRPTAPGAAKGRPVRSGAPG
ncbi:DNA-binding LytR/AlgR family response regulator [Streptosporangium becharense]|uniref:DNA-binding LytR/AlgR family response regulator n=1 Tax=Streptosporangium becharense TaxID=1816182 RepID=A0A7W9MFH5_9ACTN|nr:LytTR family DNA-binding domain-containing protein [Streptosporangium becharense]MBB2912776.1 DNA-binding LytR/AlgR family response regulator [Streptosporangium becharense]MBB5818399.1 DNA-binding LytR/AlgR family response regulator [Streptosporangium becharense]